jgi:hypothetical protein
MQFFYRFDHDEMNFNTIPNCIIGIKICVHVYVCVCVRVRARAHLVRCFNRFITIQI